MKLSVATPVAVVLDRDDVAHVRAEDATGAFGILPGHADFLTALSTAVVTWRDAQSVEHHLAVRGGMLEVRGGDAVTIATREAVAGDDLERLRSKVLADFARRRDDEAKARVEAQRLYLAALREMLRLAGSDPPVPRLLERQGSDAA